MYNVKINLIQFMFCSPDSIKCYWFGNCIESIIKLKTQQVVLLETGPALEEGIKHHIEGNKQIQRKLSFPC